MNHSITIGGLLLSIGLLGGIGTICFAVLSLFANMMADAQGDNGKSGCIALVVGAALTIGCVIGLFA
jgi:acid phosphatase family membrane protein YuiD